MRNAHYPAGSRKEAYGIVEPNPPEAPKDNPPLVHFNRGVWVLPHFNKTLHCVESERNIRTFIGVCGRLLGYPVLPNGKETGRCQDCERGVRVVPEGVDVEA